jgi:hypothetical protein
LSFYFLVTLIYIALRGAIFHPRLTSRYRVLWHCSGCGRNFCLETLVSNFSTSAERVERLKRRHRRSQGLPQKTLGLSPFDRLELEQIQDIKLNITTRRTRTNVVRLYHDSGGLRLNLLGHVAVEDRSNLSTVLVLSLYKFSQVYLFISRCLYELD